jgi:hypothetical protein
MDQSYQHGQENFNLPHDVIKLPSKGVFYKPKKDSLKIGYLTAQDENILMSQNIGGDGVIRTLLRNKIYEPGFNIGQLINGDVQAILLFLRNTSFGPEYEFQLKDPQTEKLFNHTILLDEVNFVESIHMPDDDGLFSFKLKRSEKNVKLKLLNLDEENELDKLLESYPQQMINPKITKRLEYHIVEIDGNSDKGDISKFITQMPIQDSKDIRKFLLECEPKLDTIRQVKAPSGENVTVNVTFGAEFFRPFFGI